MALVGELNKFQLPNGDEYTLEDSKVRADIAAEFDATQTYAVGNYVMYEGQLYKFKTAQDPAGAWDPTKVDPVVLTDEMGGDSTSKANKTDLAPEFSTSEDYEVKDLVIYQKVLYKCIQAHTAGAWNAADFAATNIAVNMLKVDVDNGKLVFNNIK